MRKKCPDIAVKGRCIIYTIARQQSRIARLLLFSIKVSKTCELRKLKCIHIERTGKHPYTNLSSGMNERGMMISEVTYDDIIKLACNAQKFAMRAVNIF